ncbi:unannotated protein [freshwater metagenome]|uniref:Unannotated protein n=1 Tax=freshwater metagenome TaxID=449393 RepID=A0A6J7AUG5_9ZZZZ
MRARWFSGWIGSAGWFGNEPSSSGNRISISNGSAANTSGTTSPPMPFAVSATIFNGRRFDWSMNERTCVAKSASRSSEEIDPGSATRGRVCSASALISRRPESSPIGLAPARHILMPLYCAGLCDAVNIAPAAPSLPDAKYMRSVEASPRSTMSTPWSRAPWAKAAESSMPDTRMSRATRMRVAPSFDWAKRANAAPIDRAMNESN